MPEKSLASFMVLLVIVQYTDSVKCYICKDIKFNCNDMKNEVREKFCRNTNYCEHLKVIKHNISYIYRQCGANLLSVDEFSIAYKARQRDEKENYPGYKVKLTWCEVDLCNKKNNLLVNVYLFVTFLIIHII